MVAIFEGSVNPNHFVVWISFCFWRFTKKIVFFLFALSEYLDYNLISAIFQRISEGLKIFNL